MTIAEEARLLGVSATRVRYMRRRAAGVCVRCGGKLVTKNLCEKHRQDERQRHARCRKPLPEWRKEKKRQYMRARNRTERGQELRLLRKLSAYGLTKSAYEKLMLKQRGACAICGDKPKILHVDHSHSTGAVRGLLCTRCNPGIGYFRESPDLLRRAIVYLERQ